MASILSDSMSGLTLTIVAVRERGARTSAIERLELSGRHSAAAALDETELRLPMADKTFRYLRVTPELQKALAASMARKVKRQRRAQRE